VFANSQWNRQYLQIVFARKQTMNWNDLKVFLAIADSRSLSGAARVLGNNHSTVFRRLNELERNLGVRLFDRLPNGYVLTPAGERMRELAREADNAVQRIQLELAGQDFALTGIVRVTTAANIARTLVPAAVRNLRETHPNIVVEVAIGDSEYDLNRREADIALRATTKPPEHLIGKRIMQLDWWICCPESESDTAARNLQDLYHQPIIGADAALMRLDAFQWLESEYQTGIVARANDLSTMAAFAKAGIGHVLLPSDQEEDGLKRLFKIPELSSELWLLTHPDLRQVQRIKAVWEALATSITGSGD